jgi:hypothetical protein
VGRSGKAAIERQVFINCPFDADYWPLMQAMVFAISACGLIPRCATEADDAGEERLDKILRIIGGCRFSVHDLSRKGPDPNHGLSRFNMPFELGLCLGARRFGRHKMTLLVMEAAPFDYRRFLSDMAGRDIKHHDNDPAKIIGLIRTWLSAQALQRILPGATALQRLYNAFIAELPLLLDKAQLMESEITFVDWPHLIEEWFAGLPTRNQNARPSPSARSS